MCVYDHMGVEDTLIKQITLKIGI